MKEKKIGFKDLSRWLKVLVVFGWFLFIYFITALIAGFILGITSPLI